jgi:hypothetical protein
MPFLEVVTRCYRRPTMLKANIASLNAQTDGDFIQTLLPDDEGRGVAWSFAHLGEYAPRLVGVYVWILDDDDMCTRPSLVAELKQIAAASNPAVIMLRMDHKSRGVLPSDSDWKRPPQLGGIGCSAYVVRRDVWQRHAHIFTTNSHYSSDFDFIQDIFTCDYRIAWHKVVASEVQRISMGEPE